MCIRSFLYTFPDSQSSHKPGLTSRTPGMHGIVLWAVVSCWTEDDRFCADFLRIRLLSDPSVRLGMEGIILSYWTEDVVVPPTMVTGSYTSSRGCLNRQQGVIRVIQDVCQETIALAKISFLAQRGISVLKIFLKLNVTETFSKIL